ncbi:uncharacterized protein LOC135212821 [Macrobrachium nipponense]|uniref:uncharacterized protein LOC135212821 n=1 Tax=Macrobrachium nipponense TaxID=159736 RepID=UPI0030C8425F
MKTQVCHGADGIWSSPHQSDSFGGDEHSPSSASPVTSVTLPPGFEVSPPPAPALTLSPLVVSVMTKKRSHQVSSSSVASSPPSSKTSWSKKRKVASCPVMGLKGLPPPTEEAVGSLVGSPVPSGVGTVTLNPGSSVVGATGAQTSFRASASDSRELFSEFSK